MSHPDVEFCPSRANIDWSHVQCADISAIQVTKYEAVKYFQQPPPSDTDEVNGDDKEVDDSKCSVTRCGQTCADT